MNDLSSALTILSAMITPAVLISACGSLILATSQRLNRVIERTRKLAETVDSEIDSGESSINLLLLHRAANRTGLLQRSLFCLYLSLSVFVADSIALAVVARFARENSAYANFPILIGIGGACLLFAATLFLIAESRIALLSVTEEMDFVLNRRSANGMDLRTKP